MPETETPREPQTIRILSHEYRIRTSAGPAHMQEVADYVNRVLEEIHRETPDTQDAAILAALNIASEFLRLREMGAVPQERLERLIALVGSA